MKIVSFICVLSLTFCQTPQPPTKVKSEEIMQTYGTTEATVAVSDCLGLFEKIDRDWIEKNCTEYSTSTIGNASDYGFTEGKIGSYTLIFREYGKIEFLGDLEVRYFKKPWFQFSDDEVWFRLIVVHPALKLNDSIYVSQDIEIPKKAYQMKELGTKWVYESSCEILTLEADSLNQIKIFDIRKKF